MIGILVILALTIVIVTCTIVVVRHGNRAAPTDVHYLESPTWLGAHLGNSSAASAARSPGAWNADQHADDADEAIADANDEEAIAHADPLGIERVHATSRAAARTPARNPAAQIVAALSDSPIPDDSAAIAGASGAAAAAANEVIDEALQESLDESADAPVEPPMSDLAAPAFPAPAPEPPAGARLRVAPVDSAAQQDQLLDSVVEGLERAPPLPHVLLQILTELDSMGSSARSLAAIVSGEPVLTATLLRAANSAAAGLRRDIISVDEAVAYLGFSTVRALVLRMQLAKLLPQRKGRGYDSEKLWHHSLLVAHVGSHLAVKTGGVDPSLVSTLGLLHDIGKLAINSLFPEVVAKLWKKNDPAAPDDESFLARERRLFGGDHAFMGGFLAAQWKLPKELADAIRVHHLPGGESALDALSPPLARATRIVHVANQLAKYSEVYCADMEIDVVPPAFLMELDLPTQLEDLMNRPDVQTAIARAKSLCAVAGATAGETGAGEAAGSSGAAVKAAKSGKTVTKAARAVRKSPAASASATGGSATTAAATRTASTTSGIVKTSAAAPSAIAKANVAAPSAAAPSAAAAAKTGAGAVPRRPSRRSATAPATAAPATATTAASPVAVRAVATPATSIRATTSPTTASPAPAATPTPATSPKPRARKKPPATSDRPAK